MSTTTYERFQQHIQEMHESVFGFTDPVGYYMKKTKMKEGKSLKQARSATKPSKPHGSGPSFPRGTAFTAEFLYNSHRNVGEPPKKPAHKHPQKKGVAPSAGPSQAAGLGEHREIRNLYSSLPTAPPLNKSARGNSDVLSSSRGSPLSHEEIRAQRYHRVAAIYSAYTSKLESFSSPRNHSSLSGRCRSRLSHQIVGEYHQQEAKNASSRQSREAGLLSSPKIDGDSEHKEENHEKCKAERERLMLSPYRRAKREEQQKCGEELNRFYSPAVGESHVSDERIHAHKAGANTRVKKARKVTVRKPKMSSPLSHSMYSPFEDPVSEEAGLQGRSRAINTSVTPKTGKFMPKKEIFSLHSKDVRKARAPVHNHWSETSSSLSSSSPTINSDESDSPPNICQTLRYHEKRSSQAAQQDVGTPTASLEGSSPAKPAPPPSQEPWEKIRRSSFCQMVLRWACAAGIDVSTNAEKARLYNELLNDRSRRTTLHRDWKNACERSRAELRTLWETLRKAERERIKIDKNGEINRRIEDFCKKSQQGGNEKAKVAAYQRLYSNCCQKVVEKEGLKVLGKEESRENLQQLFSDRRYITRVWPGVYRSDELHRLEGVFLIPSRERIAVEAQLRKQNDRYAIILRELLLHELKMDCLNRTKVQSWEVIGSEKKDSGRQSLGDEGTKPLPWLDVKKLPRYFAGDIVLEIYFNSQTGRLDIGAYFFAPIHLEKDLPGRERKDEEIIPSTVEIFLGSWTAACIDPSRWLLLTGPLQNKVLFFDFSNEGKNTSQQSSSKETLGLKKPENSVAYSSARPFASVSIGSICFQRLWDPPASIFEEDKVSYHICTACGSTIVRRGKPADDVGMPKLVEQEWSLSCWKCEKNTRVIPVSPTFLEEKENIFREWKEMNKEGSPRWNSRPIRNIRLAIKAIVERELPY